MKSLGILLILSLIITGFTVIGCASEQKVRDDDLSVESGDYQASMKIVQAGECSFTSDIPTELVLIDANKDGFSFQLGKTSVDAVYQGDDTAEVTITKEVVCDGEPEVHSAKSIATIENSTITIQDYEITWCESKGCVFNESWVLTKL